MKNGLRNVTAAVLIYFAGALSAWVGMVPLKASYEATFVAPLPSPVSPAVATADSATVEIPPTRLATVVAPTPSATESPIALPEVALQPTPAVAAAPSEDPTMRDLASVGVGRDANAPVSTGIAASGRLSTLPWAALASSIATPASTTAPTPEPAVSATATPQAAPTPVAATPTPLSRPTLVPAATPSPKPASVVQGSKGEQIAAIAAGSLGARYAFGGKSPATGFDCSGFTWYIYDQAGVKIPLHDLAGQLAAGRSVAREALLPGDLVFFQNTYKPGLSHAGIYVGDGRFVHANDERGGVMSSRLDERYWATRYLGASRPW